HVAQQGRIDGPAQEEPLLHRSVWKKMSWERSGTKTKKERQINGSSVTRARTDGKVIVKEAVLALSARSTGEPRGSRPPRREYELDQGHRGNLGHNTAIVPK